MVFYTNTNTNTNTSTLTSPLVFKSRSHKSCRVRTFPRWRMEDSGGDVTDIAQCHYRSVGSTDLKTRGLVSVLVLVLV